MKAICYFRSSWVFSKGTLRRKRLASERLFFSGLVKPSSCCWFPCWNSSRTNFYLFKLQNDNGNWKHWQTEKRKGHVDKSLQKRLKIFRRGPAGEFPRGLHRNRIYTDWSVLWGIQVIYGWRAENHNSHGLFTNFKQIQGVEIKQSLSAFLSLKDGPALSSVLVTLTICTGETEAHTHDI